MTFLESPSVWIRPKRKGCTIVKYKKLCLRRSVKCVTSFFGALGGITWSGSGVTGYGVHYIFDTLRQGTIGQRNISLCCLCCHAVRIRPFRHRYILYTIYHVSGGNEKLQRYTAK